MLVNKMDPVKWPFYLAARTKLARLGVSNLNQQILISPCSRA